MVIPTIQLLHGLKQAQYKSMVSVGGLERNLRQSDDDKNMLLNRG